MKLSESGDSQLNVVVKVLLRWLLLSKATPTPRPHTAVECRGLGAVARSLAEAMVLTVKFAARMSLDAVNLSHHQEGKK
jgi:hypothetical protein